MKSITTIALTIACVILATATLTHAKPTAEATPIESLMPQLAAAEKAGNTYEAVALSVAMLKN